MFLIAMPNKHQEKYSYVSEKQVQYEADKYKDILQVYVSHKFLIGPSNSNKLKHIKRLLEPKYILPIQQFNLRMH